MVITVTLQAAVHLGSDYLENPHSTKNQPQRTVTQLFDVTKKLVRDQTEVQGISVIKWQQRTFESSYQMQKPTYSPTQCCVWEGSKNPVSAWKGKNRLLHVFIPMSRIGSKRRGADGVRVDNFPTIHYIAEPRRDQEHDD